MNSEFELDEDIKKLNIIAATPELYSSFLSMKGLDIIISLLGHENTGNFEN